MMGANIPRCANGAMVSHMSTQRWAQVARTPAELWEAPAPDFVLEDLSPANWRRDAVDKRLLYQRFGVRDGAEFAKQTRSRSLGRA